MNETGRGRAATIKHGFTIHHDLRAAIRSLHRSKGFVAVAVISLGLGIGLNTTMLTELDAIRQPYVPYDKPEQLATVETRISGPDPLAMTYMMVSALLTQRPLYQHIALWSTERSYFEADGRPIVGRVVIADESLFTILGVRPVAGRLPAGLSPTNAVAVISYRVWNDEFGRVRDLQSVRLMVGGTSYPVVAAMPPAMSYPMLPGDSLRPEVWLVFATSGMTQEQLARYPNALVRMRPNESVAGIATQLGRVAGRVVATFPWRRALANFRVLPARPEPGTLRPVHAAMVGTTILVLVVACLNLANLMLARGLSKKREFAVRMALGANGVAIARYVFAECAIVSMFGGLVGGILSIWGVGLVARDLPREIEAFGFLAPHFSWHTMVFCAVVTLTALAITGIGPALAASGVNLTDAMKSGGTVISRRNRSYAGLVVAEIALSLCVLMCAALLVRAAYRARVTELPEATARLYQTSILTRADACRLPGEPTNVLAGLADRLASIGGIRYAAVASRAESRHHLVTSDESGGPLEALLLGYRIVTPDYFRALGIGITVGRDFLPGDELSGSAAIINWPLAAKLWPLQSPIGRAIKLGPADGDAQWVRVVGLAGTRPTRERPDTALPSLVVAGEPQCGDAQVNFQLSGDDPKALVAAYALLRSAVIQGSVPPPKSALSDQRQDVASRTLMALVFTTLGAFVLALSSLGTFGASNYVVVQRMREFETRCALGASPASLRRAILHEGLAMALAGTGIGAVGALWFGHLLGPHWLNRVEPTDVIALLVAESVIIGTSIVACMAPAWRASRANPVECLRSM